MEENKFEEMELKDIFLIVWKRRALLAIVTIATILIGVLATIVIPEKVYQSETVIEVSGIGTSLKIGSSTDQSIQNLLNEIIKPLDMSFDSYVKELLDDKVLEATIEDLNLKDTYSVESLRSKLSVIGDMENQTINVKFSSSDPKEPPKVLNAVIENFMDYITTKLKTNSEEISNIVREQTELEKQKYENTFENYESFINENKSVDEYEIESQAMTKQIVDFKTALKNLEIKEEGVKAAIKENNSSPSSGGGILQTNDGGSVYIGDAKKGLNITLAEVVAMKNATAKSIGKLEEEIKQLNLDYQKAEIEAIGINQKLNIAKESYESFAKTYETIETISSFDKGKLGISISEEPKEADKIQTNSKIKLLMIVVLGFLFGIVATFIKAHFDSKKIRK